MTYFLKKDKDGKFVKNDVGTFYTADWSYDVDNRTVSVSIKDDLEEWQDINVEGFNYDPRNPNKVLPNRTMLDLYKWLWERTSSRGYKMQRVDELDDATKTKLNSTYIEYPLLKQGNAEFVDAKSIRKSPLAEHIFDLGGIVSLFMTSEMISITKQPTANWEELKPLIMAEIMDYLSTGEDIVATETNDTKNVGSISLICNKNINIRNKLCHHATCLLLCPKLSTVVKVT